jgi:oligoribonuclease
MVWVDLETTSLEPKSGRILEIGIVITDLELNIQATKMQLVWGPEQARMKRLCSQFILDMHTKSELWDDAQEMGVHDSVAEKTLMNFIREHIPCDEWAPLNIGPMCGSTVAFDRNWLREYMPSLEGLFHYRSIDISTVKELCKRWNPRVYSLFRPDGQPTHRALPDLSDTLKEAGYYKDNFLWEDDPGEPVATEGKVFLCGSETPLSQDIGVCPPDKKG